VNVTRHVGLVMRRRSGGAAESVIVTAHVPVATTVAVTGELLEVGIQFVLVSALASLLDQEEDDTNDDGNSD
jgi:hypothetical protein